jgi:L-aspartate oxidase
VAVDEWGRTSLENLWACGETSATGVHGANRLASNSLLEALVYGSRVATDVANIRPWKPSGYTQPARARSIPVARTSAAQAQAITDLRNVMYANVGLVRNAGGLREALARIAELEAGAAAEGPLRNLLVAGRLIAEAAAERQESRGSHHRSDYPKTDESLAKRSFSRLRSVA